MTPENASQRPEAALPNVPLPCASVEFDRRRWRVAITLRDAEGDVIGKYVACADNGITYGDGIFFGTESEYEEAMQDA